MSERDRESLTGKAREVLLTITKPEPLADIARRHDLDRGAASTAANQLANDRALVVWVEGARRGRKRIVAPAGTPVPESVATKKERPSPAASGIVAAAITLLEARDLDDKTARAAALSLLRKA